jgi:hypothetical protein
MSGDKLVMCLCLGRKYGDEERGERSGRGGKKREKEDLCLLKIVVLYDVELLGNW